MIQNNYFNDNPDLLEQFENIVNWEEIVKFYEDEFQDGKKYQETGDEKLAFAPNNVDEAKEYYRTILTSLGDIIKDSLAPVAQKMDQTGLKLENGKVTFPEEMIKAYNDLKDAGLQPYALSRHFGGMGLPAMVQALFMEVLARGDASMAIAFGCTNIGEVLERFASPEISEKWITKLASGEYTCAMALTEPNFGSDLSNVATRAVKDEDGNWKLTGTKRFITHACGFDNTPAIILTLARTGEPGSGARGLSFFIVESKDIEVANIEKKMGLHCSPTCEIVYEDSPGVLIGEEGTGLTRGAMGMMNAARLSVASQSMGVAQAAYEEAKKYASERVQFGKEIEKIPAVRKMLNHMEREIAAMRCLLVEAARSVDGYIWRKERLKHEGLADRAIRKDTTVAKWEKLASLFTPLSKYYISEGCNTCASESMQIFGGSGYTEEYDVARIYRDARITTIYEGTTQLQTVACIGGIISGMAPNGILRKYMEELSGEFTASEALVANFATFEEVLVTYKGISDGEKRDELAFEVVESYARYFNGFLLERSAASVDGESRDKRLSMARDYNLDSASIMKANLIRLESGAASLKEPALV